VVTPSLEESSTCIPFPLGISEGEGEDLERGAAPLLDAPLERWGIKGGFKGGEALLRHPIIGWGERGRSFPLL